MQVSCAHDDHINLSSAPILESCHLALKVTNKRPLLNSLWPDKTHWLCSVTADDSLSPILDTLKSNILCRETGSNHKQLLPSKGLWISRFTIQDVLRIVCYVAVVVRVNNVSLKIV